MISLPEFPLSSNAFHLSNWIDQYLLSWKRKRCLINNKFYIEINSRAKKVVTICF